jgi:hypothetical protein
MSDTKVAATCSSPKATTRASGRKSRPLIDTKQPPDVDTIDGSTSVMTGRLNVTNDKAEETVTPLAVTSSTETDETGSAGDKHCTEEPDTDMT